jgi:hypothetical protein
MKRALCLAACVAVMGCAGGSNSDTESRAALHIAAADSLERVAQIREAVMEYSIVAEMYPMSSYYPLAVRKAALLSLTGEDIARGDSAALHWLTRYQALPLSKGEREAARTYEYLLGRIAAIRQELDRQIMVADSLAGAQKRQQAVLLLQTRRVQELEDELKTASSELTKLKEVDQRLSRTRNRK